MINSFFITLRRVIGAALFLFLLSPAYGQHIKTGEKLPRTRFGSIFNYSGDTLDIRQLGVKLVVLDFWAHNCKGCLLSLPKIDSLQAKFKGDIQIIMVNNEGRDSTARLFEKRKKFLHKPDVPFITTDSFLEKLFAVRARPAYVWLDGNGVFRYMSDELSEADIKRAIEGAEMKSDQYRGKQKYVPDFIDSACSKYVIFHSYLTRSIPGVNLVGRRVGNREITATNTPMHELYTRAFDPDDSLGLNRPGRIFFTERVPDSVRADFLNSNIRYNYSLLLPRENDNRYRLMQQDLLKCTGIMASVVKRKVNCLTLVRTGDKDRIRTKGGEQVMTFMMSDITGVVSYDRRELRNQPFSLFSAILSTEIEHKLNLPFFDATGYAGNIDMAFRGKVLDEFKLEEIRKELRKYGLDLRLSGQKIDTLLLDVL